MEKTQVSKSIITVQISGLGILILVLWLDDLFDLPELIGVPYRSIMLVQTIVATILCVALSVWLTIYTTRILKRLKNLEGLLSVCSFCKKIRVNEEWVAIEHYVSEHSDAIFSHGFCPDCAEKHYGEYYKKK